MTADVENGGQSFWNAIGTYGGVVRGALARWTEDNVAGVSDPRRWLLCSAAASAIVGSSADAEMIYSGILNESTTGSMTIDVYGHDVVFYHWVENRWSWNRNQFKGFHGRDAAFHLMDGGGYPVPAEMVGAFEFGEILRNGRGSRYATYLAGQTYWSGEPPHATGQFTLGKTLFAGLDLREPDGRHTAWIRLRIDDLDANQSPDRLTVFDWAYETKPGLNVSAGSLTTIPEPGTLALASLALGCAGLDMLRRRRRFAAPAQPPEAGH